MLELALATFTVLLVAALLALAAWGPAAYLVMCLVVVVVAVLATRPWRRRAAVRGWGNADETMTRDVKPLRPDGAGEET